MDYRYKYKMKEILKFVAAITVGCLIVFAFAMAQQNCEANGGSYEYDWFEEEFYCEYD